MRIIYNNILPFKGFKAINLFGLLFVRNEFKGKVKADTINHEAIHSAQMRELGYIFFYIIYFLEWLYRVFFHASTAYKGLSFEIEAREHEWDFDYLAERKHFAQWRKK